MIISRKELKKFILYDRKAQGAMLHPFLSSITYSEQYLIRKYLTILRHYEFHINMCHSKKNGGAIYYYHKILKSIYKLLWRKYSLQTGIYIAPNSCGKGLSITHVSYVHVDDIVHMGDNCSILPMVLFGKSGRNVNDNRINVGNNVLFCTGCTILGPVNIGSNVVVAAGAVVTSDIPDNCIVGGVPAKILKMKNNNKI